MYQANINTINTINSPVRKITARVEHYRGSALVNTFFYNDNLQTINIERVGDMSKFFGFGVCQKANVKLRDINRALSFNTDDKLIISFGAGEEYISPFSDFYITEVHRDENSNGVSITAYDNIIKAAEHTVAELNQEDTMTNSEFFAACARLIGCSGAGGYFHSLESETAIIENLNFDGSESLRIALDAFAEATQTIYYIQGEKLMVRALKPTDAPVLTIGKASYKELKSSENRRLATICHATELGDNVSATTGVSGTTQYVRNNAFWEMRQDIASLVEAAVANVGGLTLSQFDCKWRGNFLLEIGDRIALVAKDDSIIESYVINDVIEYNGALSQHTQWSYTENKAETAENPSTLGEVLNQTSAKVDKVNREIELVVSETNANTEAISSLTLNTESIDASVSRIEENTEAALKDVNSAITDITNRVDMAISAEDVTIAIKNEIANGVEKITTGKGFTFNDTGLTIEEISDTTNNKIKTTITNNGMTVYANNDEMLVANDNGVVAKNLHANTYLIIGTKSRFEDYGERTGCFWIGG